MAFTACAPAVVSAQRPTMMVVAQTPSTQRLATPIATEGCAAIVRPGASFAWEVFADGQRTNRGMFHVQTVTGEDVVMDQLAEGTQHQVAARFVGTICGSELRVFNTHPSFPEHWTGVCTGPAIEGTLEGYAFRMVPSGG